MKQLLEFIPLIIFFVTYKLGGIQQAAIALVLATIIQLILLKIIYSKIEKTQWFMALAVVFFGSLTAYFNNIEFLKWKVTIVYAILALILLISQYGFKTPIIKKLLGKEITLPEQVWNRLNFGWAMFFILCLLANVFISTLLSDDIWVDFKSFGLIAMAFIATLATGFYIYRFLPKPAENSDQS